jgi:hypothetical protein
VKDGESVRVHGQGSGFVTDEKLSRRDFLRRVLGMGGVAVAALVLVACVPGEEDDDDDEEDDD